MEHIKEAKTVHKSGEICIERSIYMTEYLLSEEEVDESMLLKRAKAIGYYLKHKTPLIHETGKLVGTMTSKEKGIHLYPDLNDLVIWRDLTRDYEKGKITKEECILLNRKIFPYWMNRDTISHFEEKNLLPKAYKILRQQGFCKVNEQGGIVPDFKHLLINGFESVLEEIRDYKEKAFNEVQAKERIAFYEGIEAIGGGLISYVEKLKEMAQEYSQEAEDIQVKEHYMSLIKLCERMPFKPAESFLEAVQSIWFYVIIMGAEYSLEGMNLGRLDQLLYPYYKKDVENGKLDNQEVVSILSDLWEKLGEVRRVKAEKHRQYDEGSLAVTVGGVDINGKDCVNELTYLFIQVIEKLNNKRPILILRVHDKINEEKYVQLAHEKRTIKGILIADDEKNINLLARKEVSLDKCRDYVLMSNEVLGIPGLSYDGGAKMTINLVAMVELALYNGRRYETGKKQWGPLTGEPENYESFEDFIRACKVQGNWLIKECLSVFRRIEEVVQENLPIPFTSLFIKGAIEKGKDLTQGCSVYMDEAVRFVGFKEVVEVLVSVGYTVFEKEYCSFKELMQGVKYNFEGYKALEDYLYNNPKYGEEHELPLRFSKWLKEFIMMNLESYRTIREGIYFGTYGMNTAAINMGKQTFALPNGRRAYNAFDNNYNKIRQEVEEVKLFEA